jgi:peptide chain release factor subunit 1
MIATLERVMAGGGHTHLVLAGNQQLAALVRRELPKPLADKLVDIVPGVGGQNVSEIVATTLAAFVAQEERESQAMVAKLQHAIHTHGLAVAGTTATLQALRRGQADVLVMAQAYNPLRGWKCAACGALGADRVPPPACPTCGEKQALALDLKEEMARLAAQHGCVIETVKDSDTLLRLGGVGCLLRYRTAAQSGEDEDNEGAQ